MKRLTIVSVVAAAATSLMGCSIHSQSPIKEVAYDFSDYAQYDHPHATSPDYRGAAESDGEASFTNTAVDTSDGANSGPRFDGPAIAPSPVRTRRSDKVISNAQIGAVATTTTTSSTGSSAAPVVEAKGAGPEVQVNDVRAWQIQTYPILVPGRGVGVIGVGVGPGGFYGQRRTDVVTHTEKHSDYVEHHEQHAAQAVGF